MNQTTLNDIFIASGALIIGILAMFVRTRSFVFTFMNDWATSEEGSKALNKQISNYLSSKDSELAGHKSDPIAHESMRGIVNIQVEGRFDNLERMITASQLTQREELERFRKDSFDKLTQLTSRVIDLLEKQMDTNT